MEQVFFIRSVRFVFTHSRNTKNRFPREWQSLLCLVRWFPSKLRVYSQTPESGKKRYHPLCCGFQRSYCTEILCGWSIVDSQTLPPLIRTFFDEMRSHPSDLIRVNGGSKDAFTHHDCGAVATTMKSLDGAHRLPKALRWWFLLITFAMGMTNVHPWPCNSEYPRI